MAWVWVDVNTNNRDRRGGHQNSVLASEDGSFQPAGRKFAKRRKRREQRREQARITSEALRLYHAEVQDYYDVYGEYEYLWDEVYEDWESELDEPTDYSDYEESYWFDEVDYGSSSYEWEHEFDPMQDYFVQREDVGKSLGEILREVSE